MDYAKMRVIAEDLGAHAERLEGSWSVEIGPSGPVLAMMCPPKRHEGTIRRMRRPDAVVIPERVLDEEGLAVDAKDGRPGRY
nr:hypothetical protein [Streptomyces sp. Act143]